MNEIVVKNLTWYNYQLNIVIAILLGLYHYKEFAILKEQLGNYVDDYNNFVNKLIDSVKIDDMYFNEGKPSESVLSKREDNDRIILYIDKDKYTTYASRKITYLNHFLDKFRTYLSSLRRNDLRDDVKNLPSWNTLVKGLIDEIDTTCVLKDYKLSGLKYIQAIASYVLNHEMDINWLKITPKFSDNLSILDDSSWEVNISLSLNRFIKIVKDGTVFNSEQQAKKPVKYSARELKFIDYLKDNARDEVYRIEQEEILEALNPDGHADDIVRKNPSKFVSNFISRLNKKYLHNTGRKLVECKEFRNCYVVFNTFEDFGDS